MHRSSFKRLFAQLPRQGTQHQHITVPGRAAQRHHAQRMDPRDKMSPTRQRERLVPKSPPFFFPVIVLALMLIGQETAPAK